MKTKLAKSICHTLSNPSKMPCYGYSLPAKRCITGGKLQKIKNTICSICYAMKGRYIFPNVLQAMEKRFASLEHPEWSKAIIALLVNKRKKQSYFRWHDSGDIQSLAHLHKIVEVALALPYIKFWLPTREYSLVEKYMDIHPVPENLTIRLSAYMIDGEPPTAITKRLKLTSSGVSASSYNCPAPKQDNYCLDCRACWDKSVENISYRKH
jgi:hypothetical protein